MSDTPRTDENLAQAWMARDMRAKCKELERELNAAKSALKDCECAISAFLGFHSDYLSNTQVATLSETLAKLKPFINP